MRSYVWIVAMCCVIGSLMIRESQAAPQSKPEEEKHVPMPYQYEYEVNDPPTKLYFGADENQNEGGRTEGKYYVWLPDGRLMTVTYYVEGDSGFVPKISFSDANYSPPPPTHQLHDNKNKPSTG